MIGRNRYFRSASDVVEGWREQGPVTLTPETDPQKPGSVLAPLGEELRKPHGLYLYKSRVEMIRYFPPK